MIPADCLLHTSAGKLNCKISSVVRWYFSQVHTRTLHSDQNIMSFVVISLKKKGALARDGKNRDF